jgi:hypothetical protein
VAALVARGPSEWQIAAELTITERTAEDHVAHILDKLGFRTRVQIAAWAVNRGVGAAGPATTRPGGAASPRPVPPYPLDDPLADGGAEGQPRLARAADVDPRPRA